MNPGSYAPIFDRMRQQAAKYVQSIPTDARQASGSLITTQTGAEVIDFYSGAGTLNYGHDNDLLSTKLCNYLKTYAATPARYGINRARDLFFKTVQHTLLEPRNWDYTLQLSGPTGANALEAAVRIARKAKGRQNVVSFTQGFKVTEASGLAVSAGALLDQAAGVSLSNAVFMPYDGCFGPDVDSMAYLERLLDDQAGSAQRPAAVVVETVLGQGGVNVLTWRWLSELQALCQRHDMLLIMDDTQVGCGRTGHFFSFETAAIQPDIIVLSKSLSGFGLPMSVLLLHPSLPAQTQEAGSGRVATACQDQELALVTAAHALQEYWQDDQFSSAIRRKEGLVRDWLENIVHSYPQVSMMARGRGLIQALVMPEGSGLAVKAAATALQHGLAIDTSGANEEVLKVLPALTITDDLLLRGLEIVDRVVAQTLASWSAEKPGNASGLSLDNRRPPTGV